MEGNQGEEVGEGILSQQCLSACHTNVSDVLARSIFNAIMPLRALALARSRSLSLCFALSS